MTALFIIVFLWFKIPKLHQMYLKSDGLNSEVALSLVPDLTGALLVVDLGPCPCSPSCCLSTVWQSLIGTPGAEKQSELRHAQTHNTHPVPQWIVGPFSQPLGVLETPIWLSGVSHTWLAPLSHINTLSTHPDTLCQWKVPSTPDFPWTILTWGHQREAVMDT